MFITGSPWDTHGTLFSSVFFLFLFFNWKRKTHLVFLFYREAFNWWLGLFGGSCYFFFNMQRNVAYSGICFKLVFDLVKNFIHYMDKLLISKYFI